MKGTGYMLQLISNIKINNYITGVGWLWWGFLEEMGPDSKTNRKCISKFFQATGRDLFQEESGIQWKWKKEGLNIVYTERILMWYNTRVLVQSRDLRSSGIG